MKRLLHILLLLSLTLSVSASTWTTHFAYNSVDQIAAGDGVVYGVSSGSLLSVEAQTERIRTYSHQDGMHGHTISCIHWLEPIRSLMIMYTDGKMDLLHNGQFTYVPDLYEKNVTFSKLCHSVTLRDSMAYMAMDYGIQTFHIRKREFVDTYFIGPEAHEIPIYSIAFTSQALYAAGDTILYAASLDDNIVDYSYWSELPLPSHGKIQGIASAAGVLYLLQNHTCYRRQGNSWYAIDNQSYNALSVVDRAICPGEYPTVSCDGLWMAASEQGLIRQMETGERITYRLDGPLINKPYRLSYQQGTLYMLAGGRWAVQNQTPGCVMRYDGSSWHNISQQEILNKVGYFCLDMMNAAVDPADPTHFYVTSYGTGMYEFRGDQCVERWGTTNSIIGTAAVEDPYRYTRTDGAIYDAQGNLWLMVAGDVAYNIVIFTSQGEQIGLNAYHADGSREIIHTVGQLIFDNKRPNYVWGIIPRSADGRSGVMLIDTKGTITQTDDDHILYRNEWTDSDGNTFNLSAIYSMRQDEDGNIWLATNTGVYIVPATTDYFQSDLCYRLTLRNEEGNLLFEEEAVNDIEFDNNGHAWIAGASTGVYVVSASGDSILGHYTMDNSALPSNSILSLAYDKDHGRMYVGSSLGLAAYHEQTTSLQEAEKDSQSEPVDMGSMLQWSTHLAYTSIEDLQLSENRVYALSEGSLCAIDKDDESMYYYSKLNGLNGSSIHNIAFDPQTQTLVITYDDGLIDLLTQNSSIHLIADLYLKQMNTSKQVQDITFHNGTAYMAMPFGIVAMNLRKQEISDTYYVGEGGAEVPINAIAVVGDSIYAASGNVLYKAYLRSNLVDFALWKQQSMSGTVTHLFSHDDALYMLMDSVIYRGYQPISSPEKFTSLSANNTYLLASTRDGRTFEVNGSVVSELSSLASYTPTCVRKEGSTYWLGTSDGVLHIGADGSVQKFNPDGPSTNMPYSMTTYGSQLWAVPGGRWASGELRRGQVMYFNGTKWDNISYGEICRRISYSVPLFDFCHVAVDPADPAHFFVASFGTGLIEFRSDGTVFQYNHDNSPLVSLVNNSNRYRYCRVDGIAFDSERNLWMVNTGDLATNIHILSPQGGWYSFNLNNGSQRFVLNTVSKILVDNRYPNWKWIASAREQAALVLIDDNGTPLRHSDDRTAVRSTFVDQDGKSITLQSLRSIAQDHNGDLWLGTSEGILVIDAGTNMFATNACRRMKISRHDGTNLADYLLGTEQINAIAFAGGNRIWVGTEVSGVYLIHMVTKEGIYEPEIIAHFTTTNSPMPSDCVLSLAINQENGEVYIGTSKGLVSYRGDATDPEETYSSAYVYPNPVRPNFEGTITIGGLMDNTTVYIADAAGNVVCRTHSNGGTAVWDGKTQSGKRAHSGVYTIYCNTADGQYHTTLKLLLMH